MGGMVRWVKVRGVRVRVRELGQVFPIELGVRGEVRSMEQRYQEEAGTDKQQDRRGGKWEER